MEARNHDSPAPPPAPVLSPDRPSRRALLGGAAVAALAVATDPRFDVPAAAARWGDRLYLVNARFTSPQTPDTTFNAVAVTL